MFGLRFRLKASTIAVARRVNRAEILYVPKDAEILVLDDIALGEADPPNRQVSIEWEGRVICMFVVDILERGELVAPACKPEYRTATAK
jgi:hypothetical protein